MTEHAAVIFVFFFLAEYASIVLICILTCILFLGGYLLNLMSIVYFIQYITTEEFLYNEYFDSFLSNPLVEGILCSTILGFKTCIMVFTFI
jgi:NADH-ubiquinone oxidoreductase chain 1